MVEKPMQMSDTDDVQDEETAKPMGSEPDKEEEKMPEEPTEKSSGGGWWMWLAVFLVGVAVGAFGYAWLL